MENNSKRTRIVLQHAKQKMEGERWENMNIINEFKNSKYFRAQFHKRKS